MRATLLAVLARAPAAAPASAATEIETVPFEAKADVRVNGGRARVLRRQRGHRLRAAIDLRGAPRRVVRLNITGTTSSGRHVRQTRRYRTCTRRK